MLFWISLAGLVAAVTLAITRPLMRTRTVDAFGSARAADAAADIAVYKDQLKEIAADEARGSLLPAEAESARAEIARRLLRSSAQPETTSSGDMGSATEPSNAEASSRSGKFGLSLAMLILLPLASLGLYLGLGAPGAPDYPLSERLAEAVDAQKPNDLVAKVEAHLRNNPNDGTGWDVLAPVYYSMGRYADAATAYANAMRLISETPQRLQGFANSRIRLENGVIPEDARRALERLLVIDPKRHEAQIWLALAKEQDGKLAEAAADYRKLVAEAPVDAPWKKMLEARVASLETPGSAPQPAPDGKSAAGPQTQTPAQTQPSAPQAPDVAAVAAMSPAEREAFVGRMVAGLAERLKSDGSDTEGWIKLIRAYQVLGRRDDAEKALGEARDKLKDDKPGLARVEGLAKQLGLGG
ncbi:c-type cytochrome biogenesis protein CcmI [Hyphomicrobium methylovorum]|uniref:c-type cytochrome biogenesis protein CcmI n=1 Tax=Hyphomicrobium methylovorum TaxID=84 RepID=UPI0015E6A363|nr:c-type cytochrome biogenesis protein CcmI [Hyphomicrobium methylovorum]MBA2124678.1 c-type cytochrome biogenesis protein CcmI [Hyphomicrobium methylovorum]